MVDLMAGNDFDVSKVHELTFSDECRVNMPDEVILEQVAQNIRRGLPQARSYQPNDGTIALVCGGPSLKTTLPELREVIEAGGKVVTVNGAYQWCIDQGIRVSMQIVIDAREFSTRFVETPVKSCQYFLAAQCHPKAFELCRDREVTIWHVLSAGEPELKLLKEYYFDHLAPVQIGTTVAIRALSLLRMLGFMKFEIFGLDSCLLDNEHHAYAQTENDNELICSIWIKPKEGDQPKRRFRCTAWMAKQAQDFIELTQERGELFLCNVHGDGLIAAMIETGAELTEGE